MLTTLLAVFALSTAIQDQQPPDTVVTSPVLQLEQTAPEAAPESGAILNTAGEYAAFHQVVADLRDAPIGSSEDLDSAMDRLTSFYGEERLARAWIAYAAMIAAQHPEYLDDVREVADYYGPQAAMSGLMYDPAYATSFTHSTEAQASVVDAIERDSTEIREVSERYRAAAYDLQSERWARRSSGDRAGRLRSLENADERPIEQLGREAVLSMGSSIGNGVPASALFDDGMSPSVEAASPALTLRVGDAAPAPDRERIGRILSVAALQSLSSDPNSLNPQIESLLSDPAVERCMVWVRLDLQQCVAAGHFKYEDSFCIAEHALLDVSRCLGASAATGSH
jgi:hypothetical protein